MVTCIYNRVSTTLGSSVRSFSSFASLLDQINDKPADKQAEVAPAQAALSEPVAEDDIPLHDLRAPVDAKRSNRSRRERTDSVTESIIEERKLHLERLNTFSPDAALVELARKAGLGRRRQPNDSAVFKKQLDGRTGIGAGGFALHLGCVSEKWPKFRLNLPEIALAGHTNCGKSTLVNALAGLHPRAGPAGVSERAGWTDYISFYQIGKKPPVLTLADLPGYGHAVASLSVTKEWKRMTKDYLSGERRQLIRCCVLIDSTRGLAREDFEILYHLEKTDIEHQIVLTKADLLSPVQVAQCMMAVKEDLKGSRRLVRKVLAVSGHTGAAVSSMWEELRSRSLLEPTSLVSQQAALKAQAKEQKRREKVQTVKYRDGDD